MAPEIIALFAHTLYNGFPLEDGQVCVYDRFHSHGEAILHDKDEGILQIRSQISWF